MKKILVLLGRIGISIVFVTSVASKLLSWDQTVQHTTSALSLWIAGTHLPDFMHGAVTFISAYATELLILATILEGIGGLLVLLGFKVQLGAALLILFLLPVTIVMHPFWLYSGQENMSQMTLFLKNLAILGGLFILAASSRESEG